MKRQFLVNCVLMAVCASAAFAGGEPVSVLYWNGSSLIPIDPTSGPASQYLIPAGATYAFDEAGGVAFVLAAVPGSPAPDPNTVPGQNASNPSITTPNGTTFEIPDPGNISSIVQSGDSVIVTYKDGATAQTPGTYVPPGTPPPAQPPQAPAQQPGGVAPPGPDSQLEDAIENALLDDAWVEDFLGAPLTQDKLPAHITDYLFDGTVSYVPRDNYSTDTIIQRYAVPETCSTLALLGFGTLSLLAWDSRRRTAKA